MKRTPREIGVTGIRHTNNLLLDDEIQENLRFPHSIKTFNKMKSDPIISGSLTLIKQFMKKVKFDIAPKGGVNATPEALRKAELVREALFQNMDRSFDQVVTDIITFVENGFSFHEPTYRIRKGMITWKDFPSRHASTIKGFKFDDSGNITHVTQWRPAELSFTSTNVNGKSIEIPYDRLLHFRSDSERNNPIGRSILKNAYLAWHYKRNLEEVEAIGVERDLHGIPFLEIPLEYIVADPEEDPDKYAQFLTFVKVLENMRRNEQAGLILPSDRDENGHKYFEASLLNTGGGRSHNTNEIIQRYDYRIAQSMLTDFLLMGSSSSGSFALSDNKINTFIQSLEANIEVIAEQFNRKAIPKLYELNGWSEDELCTLVYKPVSSATLSELGSFLNNVKNFITPDERFENYVRGEMGAPERDNNALYIDKPTTAHQAESQRIGMQASADRSGSNIVSQDNPETDVSVVADQIAKALVEDYRGEA